MADEKKKTTPSEPGYVDVHDSIYFGRFVNKKLFSILMVSLLALAVSVSANVFFMFHRPTPKYFASSTDGRIIPMIPLSSPVRSERWIVDWTSKTIRDALSVRFGDYSQSFLSVRDRFLPTTFQKMVASLDQDGFKKYIIDNRVDVYVSLENTPVIVQTGLIGGQRAWKVQAPVLLTFTNGNNQTPKRYLINLMIVRVPTYVNSHGIVIANFTMSGTGSGPRGEKS